MIFLLQLSTRTMAPFVITSAKIKITCSFDAQVCSEIFNGIIGLNISPRTVLFYQSVLYQMKTPYHSSRRFISKFR